MFVTTASIGDTILSALWGFLLTIDGLIYNLICYVTEIFNSLVKLNVFTNEDYNDIVSRIYIVLGLIMLFVLAYSLLKAIINPENFSKGETSFSKLIGNTVSSLIIIAILPTVFSVAFNIQNSLVNQGTIYKIILGNDNNVSSSTDEIKDGGRDIAYYTFTSFFYENDQSDGENTDSSENSYDGIKSAVYENGESFTKFSTLSEKVVDKSITYMFPVSTIAGIVILYILLNFCFDVAVRVVKLAFYQIIAPIPVMCRIIPGGKMKDVFSKWLKQVISLFVEVFIRMAAIAFGVKFVQIIVDSKDSLNIDASTGARRIVMALLIMAVVIFIKQIPKIIGDMFGIDTAGMKLGLTDKLAMGGAFAGGAIVGGAISTLGRNVARIGKRVKDTEGGFKNKLGAFVSGVPTIGSGVMSSAYRGFKGGKGAKSLADMKKASVDAANTTSEIQAKRSAYRASHRDTSSNNPLVGFMKTTGNVIRGRASDYTDQVGAYFGFGDELQTLQAEQSVYQEGMGFKKELFELAADNERVLAYKGMKQAAQEKDINNYISDIEKQINAKGFTNRDNTGYYKLNSITGQKEYYKNSSGNIISDLTSAAIEQKTADIKMYDDAAKLASLSAIYDKINSGDGRYTAVIEKEKVWKQQHADMVNVSKLDDLSNLDASQMSAINSALASNDKDAIKRVLDALEGNSAAMAQLNISSSSIMSNDKKLKSSNGDVTEKIAKKIQEKKKDGK